MRPLVFLISLQLSSFAESANILFLSTVASPSHSYWCKHLINLLAKKGHQVTVLDTIVHNDFAENVTSYVLESAYLDHLGDLEDHSLAASDASSLLAEYSHETCKRSINSPSTKKLLDDYSKKERPFDLIIHDAATCECFLGFVHKFGNPTLVRVTAFMDPSYLLNSVGNYDNPSYVPMHLSSLEPATSFFQRLKNLYYVLHQYYLHNWWYMPRQYQMARQVFGDNLPPLENIAQRALVVLVNTHFSISVAKPLLPNVIQIGGFHVDQPKPLPNDIQKFLDGAKDGAIYFSFGTLLHSSDMSDKKVEMFLDVFRELPQRVIWKWKEDELPNKPNNVMISKWLPQNDILAHPNVKIFISHGGQLGTQEAIHHGVPIIYVPFAFDQPRNAEVLERKGVAVILDYKSLTKEHIKTAINEIIHNTSYQVKMQKLSEEFRDRPLPPREETLYWIEYAIKHSNSSSIRSPVTDMALSEVFLIDVALFIISVLTILGLALVSLAKYLSHILCETTKLKSS